MRTRAAVAVAAQKLHRILRAKATLRARRKQHHAAVTIQSATRRCIAEAKLSLLREQCVAITLIQALSRGIRGRAIASSLRRIIRAATDVQRLCRGTIVRHIQSRAQRAAVVLQAAMRGTFYRASTELQMVQAAALRRKSLRALHTMARLRILGTVLNRLQTHAAEERVRLASIVVQAAMRRVIALRVVTRCRSAATIIGRVARGVNVRRCSSKAVARVRLRVAKANREADPAMTIGHRIVVAVSILRSSKNLGRMMKACISLEAASRLSVWCCKSFVDDEVAVTTMFEVLRLCNRSEPHRKLVTTTLSTLLNISRDEALRVSLMSDATRISAISFTAERYKEYNGIFTQSCALLCGAARDASLHSKMKADRTLLKRVRDCRRLFAAKWKREQTQIARGAAPKKSVKPSYEAITMLATQLLA
jgi:hypothetical protein